MAFDPSLSQLSRPQTTMAWTTTIPCSDSSNALFRERRLEVCMREVEEDERELHEVDDFVVNEKMPLNGSSSPQAKSKLNKGDKGNALSQPTASLPLVRRIWTLHFLVSILTVFGGIAVNKGERKYTPVDPGSVPSHCRKAFVNVFADSLEDEDALVCCGTEAILDSPMCYPKSKPLPFTGNLATFPHAWLLPLLPVFFRLLFAVTSYLFALLPGETMRTTLLRLAVYVGTLNFRGWVLYVLFNKLEAAVVQPADTSCWYQSYLTADPACQSLKFDFSDHMVLYFAQILPLPLMEVLHTFSVQFWRSGSLRISNATHFRIRMIPILLLAGLAYLYAITLVGAFKTSAYFHIGSEILVGYVISLFVQVPYAFLQCSTEWDWLRELLFGFPARRSRRD